MPYLPDPEADSSEFTEEIFASSQADAIAKCDTLAETYATKNNKVASAVGKPQQKTRTPSKTGTYIFVCTIRVEH